MGTAFGFLKNPKNRYGREKEDGHLSTDRAESMRESFVSQEFWGEHGKERTEEESIYDEAEIPVVMAETAVEEMEETEKEEEKSCQEEGSDDGIEQRIGRIVVAPILITEERVLDEGSRESLDESAWQVAVIHFGREDGDMGGAGFEIFRMRYEEVVEHRGGCDEGAQNEGETVFPEASKEMFVRKHECR